MTVIALILALTLMPTYFMPPEPLPQEPTHIESKPSKIKCLK